MGGSGDAGDDAKCLQETPPYNSSPEWGIESGQLACSDEMDPGDPGTESTGGGGPDGSAAPLPSPPVPRRPPRAGSK